MSRKFYINQLDESQKDELAAKDIMLLNPKELLLESLLDSDSLIILCELNIDKDGNKINRSDFYGIQYAQELRRGGFRGKVLFVSFMQREKLTLDKPFNQIINTIGHSFLRLPIKTDAYLTELDKFEKLDKVEWYDIDSAYCSKEGLAQQELHQLCELKNSKSYSDDYITSRIKSCTRQVGLLTHEDTEAFLLNLHFTDLSSAINQAVIYCENLVNRNLVSTNKEPAVNIKQPWSILFLDDQVDENHELVIELEKQVQKVYCVRNTTDANKWLALNSAEGLLITLVVSDYRLYDPENNHTTHQAKQGYKFLMETSLNYPYLSLAGLSSLPRRFLLQSFKQMGIRADVFSKLDYFASESTLKILVNELISRGKEAFELTTRLPMILGGKWVYFEKFYAHHRTSIDYAINESYISNKAKVYCDNFSEGNVFFNLSDYSSPLKGKTKIPENPKFFKEFLEKMVCRRVVLWYSVKHSKVSSSDFGLVLHGSNYDVDTKVGTLSTEINTNLALRLSDFPWNATIEEKEWLINEMGEDRKMFETVESSENSLLTFAQQEIKKLNYPLHCAPNTFVNCKIWLTYGAQNLTKYENGEELFDSAAKLMNKSLQIISQVKTDPPLIQILQDSALMKTTRNRYIIFQFKSLIDFYNYLSRIKRRVKNFNQAHIDGHNNEDLDQIKNDLLQKVKKEAKKDLVKEASVLCFISELKQTNQSYPNFKAYYEAFLVFHNNDQAGLDPFKNIPIGKIAHKLAADMDIWG